MLFFSLFAELMNTFLTDQGRERKLVLLSNLYNFISRLNKYKVNSILMLIGSTIMNL